jgi:hypothetical protein
VNSVERSLLHYSEGASTHRKCQATCDAIACTSASRTVLRGSVPRTAYRPRTQRPRPAAGARTTGVWPRWPQVRPCGGLGSWPIRPERPAKRPGPPPPCCFGPGLLRHAAICASLRSAARGAGTCTFQPSASEAADAALPGCNACRTARAPPRRCGSASSTDPLIPTPPDRRPAAPAARPVGRGWACSAPIRTLRRLRRLAVGGQRPPPPVRRHPGHPEAVGHLPVAGTLSIHSAPASRTGSCRARSSAVSTTPSEYLMFPA